jgi:tRNA A37 threonylcarbamoyladenosine synthetase subunit TsaC/SUA5/YrdC
MQSLSALTTWAPGRQLLACHTSNLTSVRICASNFIAELCNKLPGCAAAPAAMTQGRPVCLPKFAAGLDKKAAEALAAQLKALDPTLYGSCEAACWLKQVRRRLLCCCCSMRATLVLGVSM